MRFKVFGGGDALIGIKNAFNKRFFRSEIVVERRRINSSLASDFAHGGACITFGAEKSNGNGNNLVAGLLAFRAGFSA